MVEIDIAIVGAIPSHHHQDRDRGQLYRGAEYPLQFGLQQETKQAEEEVQQHPPRNTRGVHSQHDAQNLQKPAR